MTKVSQKKSIPLEYVEQTLIPSLEELKHTVFGQIRIS